MCKNKRAEKEFLLNKHLWAQSLDKRKRFFFLLFLFSSHKLAYKQVDLFSQSRRYEFSIGIRIWYSSKKGYMETKKN